MTKRRLLPLLLVFAVPASPLAAEFLPGPADPNAPRFEMERDWNGEMRPRYKGAPVDEPLSTPVITPERPRVAREADPPPKIEVWGDAEVQPRRREESRREQYARRAREWEERERREQQRFERETARRGRYERERFEEEYFGDDSYWDERGRYR